jgi:hypothetical protein
MTRVNFYDTLRKTQLTITPLSSFLLDKPFHSEQKKVHSQHQLDISSNTEILEIIDESETAVIPSLSLSHDVPLLYTASTDHIIMFHANEGSIKTASIPTNTNSPPIDNHEGVSFGSNNEASLNPSLISSLDPDTAAPKPTRYKNIWTQQQAPRLLSPHSPDHSEGFPVIQRILTQSTQKATLVETRSLVSKSSSFAPLTEYISQQLEEEEDNMPLPTPTSDENIFNSQELPHKPSQLPAFDEIYLKSPQLQPHHLPLLSDLVANQQEKMTALGSCVVASTTMSTGEWMMTHYPSIVQPLTILNDLLSVSYYLNVPVSAWELSNKQRRSVGLPLPLTPATTDHDSLTNSAMKEEITKLLPISPHSPFQNTITTTTTTTTTIPSTPQPPPTSSSSSSSSSSTSNTFSCLPGAIIGSNQFSGPAPPLVHHQSLPQQQQYSLPLPSDGLLTTSSALTSPNASLPPPTNIPHSKNVFEMQFPGSHNLNDDNHVGYPLDGEQLSHNHNDYPSVADEGSTRRNSGHLLERTGISSSISPLQSVTSTTTTIIAQNHNDTSYDLTENHSTTPLSLEHVSSSNKAITASVTTYQYSQNHDPNPHRLQRRKLPSSPFSFLATTQIPQFTHYRSIFSGDLHSAPFSTLHLPRIFHRTRYITEKQIKMTMFKALLDLQHSVAGPFSQKDPGSVTYLRLLAKSNLHNSDDPSSLNFDASISKSQSFGQLQSPSSTLLIAPHQSSMSNQPNLNVDYSLTLPGGPQSQSIQPQQLQRLLPVSEILPPISPAPNTLQSLAPTSHTINETVAYNNAILSKLEKPIWYDDLVSKNFNHVEQQVQSFASSPSLLVYTVPLSMMLGDIFPLLSSLANHVHVSSVKSTNATTTLNPATDAHNVPSPSYPQSGRALDLPPPRDTLEPNFNDPSSVSKTNSDQTQQLHKGFDLLRHEHIHRQNIVSNEQLIPTDVATPRMELVKNVDIFGLSVSNQHNLRYSGADSDEEDGDEDFDEDSEYDRELGPGRLSSQLARAQQLPSSANLLQFDDSDTFNPNLIPQENESSMHKRQRQLINNSFNDVLLTQDPVSASIRPALHETLDGDPQSQPPSQHRASFTGHRATVLEQIDHLDSQTRFDQTRLLNQYQHTLSPALETFQSHLTAEQQLQYQQRAQLAYIESKQSQLKQLPSFAELGDHIDFSSEFFEDEQPNDPNEYEEHQRKRKQQVMDSIYLQNQQQQYQHQLDLLAQMNTFHTHHYDYTVDEIDRIVTSIDIIIDYLYSYRYCLMKRGEYLSKLQNSLLQPYLTLCSQLFVSTKSDLKTIRFDIFQARKEIESIISQIESTKTALATSVSLELQKTSTIDRLTGQLTKLREQRLQVMKQLDHSCQLKASKEQQYTLLKSLFTELTLMSHNDPQPKSSETGHSDNSEFETQKQQSRSFHRCEHALRSEYLLRLFGNTNSVMFLYNLSISFLLRLEWIRTMNKCLVINHVIEQLFLRQHDIVSLDWM